MNCAQCHGSRLPSRVIIISAGVFGVFFFCWMHSLMERWPSPPPPPPPPPPLNEYSNAVEYSNEVKACRDDVTTNRTSNRSNWLTIFFLTIPFCLNQSPDPLIHPLPCWIQLQSVMTSQPIEPLIDPIDWPFLSRSDVYLRSHRLNQWPDALIHPSATHPSSSLLNAASIGYLFLFMQLKRLISNWFKNKSRLVATAFYFYVDNWTIFNQYSTNFHWFDRELVEKWLFWHLVPSIPPLSIQKLDSCQKRPNFQPILTQSVRNFGYFDARLRRFLFSQIQNWTRVWNWPFRNQFQPILNNLESKWVILKLGLFDSAFFQLLNLDHVENEPILNQFWTNSDQFWTNWKANESFGRWSSQYRTNSNQFWPILALIGYFDTRPIQFQCCQFKTNQLTLKIEQFWTNQNANRHLTRNPKRRRLKFFKLIRHRFSWTTDKENTSKLGTIYSNWLTFE